MALPVIANTVRCAVEGTCPNGARWVNVLHYTKDPATTYAAAIALAQVEMAQFYTTGGVPPATSYGWADFMSDEAVVTRFTHTPLDGITASTVYDVSIVGLGTTDPLPSDTAIVITWRTARRGRSFRGRTYWAGPTESLNDATGHILATSRTQMVTGITKFITAMAANPTPLVVASYVNADVELILTGGVNDTFDRQRRRKS